MLSLRDLIVAPPDAPVRDFMYPEPVAVGVLADEDEVAQVVARYNLLAVPVVDDDGRLEGIVTVDDAIDTVLPSGWKRRLPRLFSRSGDQGGGDVTRARRRGIARRRIRCEDRLRLRGRFRRRRGWSPSWR